MSQYKNVEFEEWVRDSFTMSAQLLAPGHGSWLYRDSKTEYMWLAWQAAVAICALDKEK